MPKLEAPDSQPVTYVKGIVRSTSYRLRLDGADVSIAAAAFKLLRPDGTALFEDAALTGLPSTTPTATVPAVAWDTLPDDDPYGGRYVEAWTLDGELYTREAWASTIVPASPLTDEDLERMHSGILAEAPDGSEPGVAADLTWTGKRLQAWKRLQARLAHVSTDQSAIVSWYAFLDYLAYDCLQLIAADLATEETGGGRWATLADQYDLKTEAEWQRLAFGVDRDRDYVPDNDGPAQVSGTGHNGRPGVRRW